MPSKTRAGLSSVLCGFGGFASGVGRPPTCAVTAAVATVQESRATTNARIGDIDVRSEVWAGKIEVPTILSRARGSRTLGAVDDYPGPITDTAPSRPVDRPFKLPGHERRGSPAPQSLRPRR